MDRVLHLTIYLTDMADRGRSTRFTSASSPSHGRCVPPLAWPLAVEGMRVEVTAMAAKG
jgi:enamine deaminase RidA (YjgF/YER057c/UK114 family)